MTKLAMKAHESSHELESSTTCDVKGLNIKPLSLFMYLLSSINQNVLNKLLNMFISDNRLFTEITHTQHYCTIYTFRNNQIC